MNQLLTRLTRAAGESCHRSDGQVLDTFIANQNEPAFAVLVERHGPMVLAVCRRILRHQQDAEDAFQATFLVLARRAASVWPRDAVGSWLYGVAQRVAMKARATRARRLGREQPLDESVQPLASDPPLSDLAELLDRAIRKLPEVYRAAVVACDLEGRSRKDAAEQLGWKEGTLSGRLARARELLAVRLRRAGLTLPAGGVAAVLGGGGMSEAVSSRMLERVVSFVVGTPAVGVSAPVAALTEGVVRSMFLMKLKMAGVAILASCAIGFGVWGSAGAGDGPGVGDGPGKAGLKASTLPVGEQKLTPTGAVDDLTRFQGKWRIIHVDKEGKEGLWWSPTGEEWEAEIRGRNISIPLLTREQGEPLWFRRECSLTIDPGKKPAEITLTAGDQTIARGIYIFHERPAIPDENIRYIDLLIAASPDVRPTDFKHLPKKGYSFGLVRVNDEKAAAPPAANGPRAAPGLAGLADRELYVTKQEIDQLVATKQLDSKVADRLKARLDAARHLFAQSHQTMGIDPPDAPVANSAQQRQAELKRARAYIQMKGAQLKLEEAQANKNSAQAEFEKAQREYEDTQRADTAKPVPAPKSPPQPTLRDWLKAPEAPTEAQKQLQPDQAAVEATKAALMQKKEADAVRRRSEDLQKELDDAKKRIEKLEDRLRDTLEVLRAERNNALAQRERAEAAVKEAHAQVQRALDAERAAAQDALKKAESNKAKPDERELTVVVRDDQAKERKLTREQSPAFEEIAEGLVQRSCGELQGRKEGHPFADAKLWQKLATAGYVRVVFPKPRVIKGAGNNPEVVVEEILIPISATKQPDYVLTRVGQTYRAFFDFPEDDVTALKKLVVALP